MGSEHVINKLVANLGRLSDQELRELSELFQQGDVARAFAEVVEKIIYLRRAEHQRSMNAIPIETSVSRKAVGDQPIRPSEPAKGRFFAILNDRTLFPTTRDVVEILNSVFGLELRYKNYRRHGRRDLIQKCWRHLEKMPSFDRRRVLQSLSSKDANSSFRSEGYHELFRILSQK